MERCRVGVGRQFRGFGSGWDEDPLLCQKAVPVRWFFGREGWATRPCKSWQKGISGDAPIAVSSMILNCSVVGVFRPKVLIDLSKSASAVLKPHRHANQGRQ